jgi:hypothetical protein
VGDTVTSGSMVVDSNASKLERRQHMSQQKSAAEIVAEANGRLEDSTVKYKRVVISRLGGPEVLELREEELPEPGLGIVH